MNLRPVRSVVLGMPTEWAPEVPFPSAVRRHCACGTEMWLDMNTETAVPPGCYIVERAFQCARCCSPAEFSAAVANTVMLGWVRRGQ